MLRLGLLAALAHLAAGAEEDPAELDRSGPKVLPTFEINLDLPPRERWKHVAANYRSWWQANWENMVAIEPGADEETTQQLTKLASLMNFGHEIHEEMRGFVEALNHPEATYDRLRRMQVGYELGGSQGFFCAAIAATKKDSHVVHGRNLDTKPELMWSRSASYEVVFIKFGRRIARAVSGSGFLGLHTGMRLDNGWTIAQNTRFMMIKEGGGERFANRKEWLDVMIKAAAAGAKPSGLGIRELLLTHPTFQGAVVASTNWPWMAPQYHIFGGAGPYQGAVVTVEPTVHFGFPSRPNIQTLSAAAGRWMLVQTNDDRWKQPLDSRRMAATVGITNEWKKHGIDEEGVMQTLRMPPVCNDGTLWTWVTQPHLNSHVLDYGVCNR